MRQFFAKISANARARRCARELIAVMIWFCIVLCVEMDAEGFGTDSARFWRQFFKFFRGEIDLKTRKFVAKISPEARAGRCARQPTHVGTVCALRWSSNWKWKVLEQIFRVFGVDFKIFDSPKNFKDILTLISDIATYLDVEKNGENLKSELVALNDKLTDCSHTIFVPVCILYYTTWGRGVG